MYIYISCRWSIYTRSRRRWHKRLEVAAAAVGLDQRIRGTRRNAAHVVHVSGHANVAILAYLNKTKQNKTKHHHH